MSGPKTRKATTSRRRKRDEEPSEVELQAMIEQATVDAYDESEQTVGFFTMLEENLAMPFKTEVLGAEVTVERIDLNDGERIVAICSRGKPKQRIPILDLPLPSPSPAGAEWISALRRWAEGGR